MNIYSQPDLIEGMSGNGFFAIAQILDQTHLDNKNPNSLEGKKVGFCKIRGYRTVRCDYIPILSIFTGLGKTVMGLIYTIHHLVQAVIKNNENSHRHLDRASIGLKLACRGMKSTVPFLGNYLLYNKDKKTAQDLRNQIILNMKDNEDNYNNKIVIHYKDLENLEIHMNASSEKESIDKLSEITKQFRLAIDWNPLTYIEDKSWIIEQPK